MQYYGFGKATTMFVQWMVFDFTFSFCFTLYTSHSFHVLCILCLKSCVMPAFAFLVPCDVFCIWVCSVVFCLYFSLLHTLAAPWCWACLVYKLVLAKRNVSQLPMTVSMFSPHDRASHVDTLWQAQLVHAHAQSVDCTCALYNIHVRLA